VAALLSYQTKNYSFSAYFLSVSRFHESVAVEHRFGVGAICGVARAVVRCVFVAVVRRLSRFGRRRSSFVAFWSPSFVVCRVLVAVVWVARFVAVVWVAHFVAVVWVARFVAVE
jgi:hypothetical protein